MPADRARPGPPPNLAAMGNRAIIQVGTGFEFLLSALHVADPEAQKAFAEGQLWAGLLAGVGRRRLRALEHVGIHPIFNLTGLAWDTAPRHDAAGVLARLRELGPAEVVLTALGASRRAYRELTPPEVTREAVAGDRRARQEFLRTSWPDNPEWQASARFLLSRPGDELGDQLIDELTAWHDGAFASQADRLLSEQEAARDELVRERATWTADGLLRRVLPGHDAEPPAWVGTIVFVPDRVIRPGVVLVDHRSDYIAVFPIPDEPETDEPPEQLMRIGRALSDELRVRALRVLARGPMTVVALAAELGVPRTTLTYHLNALRAAGLITVGIDDGRWGRLRLRLDGIDDAARLLRRYVSGAD